MRDNRLSDYEEHRFTELHIRIKGYSWGAMLVVVLAALLAVGAIVYVGIRVISLLANACRAANDCRRQKDD